MSMAKINAQHMAKVTSPEESALQQKTPRYERRRAVLHGERRPAVINI
jgi:hypothetical protein